MLQCCRFYLRSFSWFFMVLGLVTLLAPVGGVLLLLGAALALVSAAMSLFVYACHGVGRLTRRIAYRLSTGESAAGRTVCRSAIGKRSTGRARLARRVGYSAKE
jgi:hypothetical protein